MSALSLSFFFCFTVCGCRVEQEPVAKPTQTEKPVPLPAAASVPAVPDLLIDDLLKRDDLVEPVKNAIRLIKANGGTTVTEKFLDVLISQYDVKFAINKRLALTVRPTKATTTTENKPVVYSTEPTTARDHLVGRNKFFRIGLEHFNSREIAGLSAAGKVRASKFLDTVFDRRINIVSAQAKEELLREGQAILQENPQLTLEPLFNYGLGFAYSQTRQFEESRQMMALSYQNFAKTEYPARVTVLPCASILWSEDQNSESPIEARQLADYFVSIINWLKHDFRETPEEHRFVAEMLLDFMQCCVKKKEFEVLDMFHDAVVEQIHVPQWIRAVTRGRYYGSLAWRYRGNGMADTVSEENRKRFEENETKSADFYRQALEINPMFPEAATSLISLVRTGHADQTEEYWFEQAIKGQVDYMSAYDSVLNGLLPQWGGSCEKMIEFADRQASKKQYDTMVPYCLVSCYMKIKDDAMGPIEERVAIVNEPKFALRVVNALDGLSKNETPKVFNFRFAKRDFFLTQKAAIALIADLNKESCDAFDELGDNYNGLALKNLWNGNLTFKLFRSTAYAFSGETEADARELNEMGDSVYETRMANSEKILKICSGVLAKFPDTKATPYFHRLHEITQLETDYINGKAVHLGFDPEMSIWAFLNIDQVRYESASTFTIDNTKSSFEFELACQAIMPGSKVVECEIEFPTLEKKHLIGHHLTPSVVLADYNSYQFSFGLLRSYESTPLPVHVPDLGQLAFGYSTLDKPLMSYTTRIVEGPNKLRLLVKPGYVEAFVNDQFIFRTSNPKIRGGRNRFKLTQPLSRKGRGAFRISNIRLQKVSDQPPPITGPSDDLIKYYQAEVDAEPNNKWSMFWLAQAIHQSGDLERATEHYKSAIELGIEKSLAALYLGDCCERTNKLTEALDWYLLSAQPEFEDVTKVFPRQTTQTYSNSNHWSAFRLSWLQLTSPDEKIRKSLSSRQSVRSEPPHELLWTVNLLTALQAAEKEDFSSAERLARQALPQCSVEEEETVLAMIEAFKSRRQFIEQADAPAFYLRAAKPIPFFQTFEDVLDPNWNRTY